MFLRPDPASHALVPTSTVSVAFLLPTTRSPEGRSRPRDPTCHHFKLLDAVRRMPDPRKRVQRNGAYDAVHVVLIAVGRLSVSRNGFVEIKRLRISGGTNVHPGRRWRGDLKKEILRNEEANLKMSSQNSGSSREFRPPNSPLKCQQVDALRQQLFDRLEGFVNSPHRPANRRGVNFFEIDSQLHIDGC